VSEGQTFDVAWRPQPGPQTALLQCPVDEIFFGGARGGGKSSGVLGHWIGHAGRYGKAARGLLVRRRFNQLAEIQRQAEELFPKLGAKLTKLGSGYSWAFPDGAVLRMAHLWDISACEQFQGFSFNWLCFEEITNWPTHDPLNRMRATLRSAEGVKSVLLATGNPGGPGHSVTKARWVDPAPRGFKVLTDQATGLTRVFIPSRLEDNKALTDADPTYEQRLMAVGNLQLVKAWRYGEWDISLGGYFDDLWMPARHVLRPFRFPSGWTFRRSFDWGSAKPYSLGMWAISPGDVVGERYFPKGSLIRFSEQYGVARNSDRTVRPNEGLRLSNLALGERIGQVSKGRTWTGCVADPSIFTEMGSESIYAQLQKGSAAAGFPLIFGRANNDRMTGWQRMRDMMEAATQDRPESPGLWVFENCTDWLRTVPTLQRDERNPDDVDTDQEDHCGDETRYCVLTGMRVMRETRIVGWA
jgi:hypothetical protein